MTNTTLKDRLTDYLKYNDYDDETLVLKLYNYLQDEVRFNNSLIVYGINELDGLMDYIINEIEADNITDLYELTDVTFSNAAANGTLTFSTLQAELEVNSNYGIDEIQEIQAEWDNTLNYEQLHIELCKREFYSYMEEKIEEIDDLYQGLTNKELLIKACKSIVNDEI